MNADRILRRLYALPPRPTWLVRLRRAQANALRWIRLRGWRLGLVATLVSAWLVAHVYYYNRLKEAEFAVDVARAQIEAMKERRYFLFKSVGRLVSEYRRHEQSVLTSLTELRHADGSVRPRWTGNRDAERRARAAPPGSSSGASAEPAPAELPAELRLVAEQYPRLTLGENVQQLTGTMVEVQTEVSRRIAAYNDAVNAYITLTDTFPGNVFAAASGFGPRRFYAANPDMLPFPEVAF
ncbi:MAG: LemA family protein [Deltaproteobacteria bacterium]|nr:LemA family protein [Deltaproteobacteria bacterium]